VAGRSLRLAPAVIAFGMLLPHQASGQTRAWDNYCTQGPFQACMSIEASLVLVPWQSGDPFPGLFSNLSLVTISMRNLQGTMGTNQPWGLQGLSLFPLLPNPAPGFSPIESGIAPSFVGTGQNVNVPAGLLSGLWDYGYASAGFISRSTQIGDGAYPIAGCSPLASDLLGLYHFEQGYFSTCGNGWVSYSWLMAPVQFSPTTVLSVTGYHLLASGAVESISCTFDVSCVTTTTPEPASFMLTAIGLVMVAGFAYRRRRIAMR
jgi:hypothetical protein